MGCAHSNVKSKNGIPTSAFQSTDPNHLTIALVGMNDFHGSLLPRERKLAVTQNGNKGEVVIKSGGAAALASMISILRDEMDGRVLIVDAGDEWQGTLESNLVRGSTVVHFFNRLGVNVAAIGNHEFDFNIENMRTRFKEAHYPYVALNIFEKKNGKHPSWENYFPSKIIEVAGVKIGVIGHSTVDTPGTTRYAFVKHLEFRDSVKLVNDEAARLRKLGAQAVLVTAHAGTFCDRKNLNEWRLHSPQDSQGECETDEITKFAAGLKPNTLDAIISGHTHQVIHHWLSGIPTVQDEAYNQHFNIIYLTFDRKTGQVLTDLTRIEGLIPICAESFEGMNHCDVRRLNTGEAPSLVPATFHGKRIIPDQKVVQWLKPIIASTEKYRTEIISNSTLPLTHFRDREGAFGNLVADVLREKARTDFSLVNSGGIRTSLDAGPITFDQIFRALPFDNLLNVIRLKGRDVKLLYRIATAGSRGIAGFSGLKLKLIPYDRDIPREDLNRDGKTETWEGNRLLEIKTSEGKELKDDQFYTVATFDFLVNGGDDMHWFMSRIPVRDINRNYSEYCRDIVTEYLKKVKVFNTVEDPLVDAKKPRVVFSE